MTVAERRAWVVDAEAEPDARPPLALRLPAEPGWRVVWMLLRVLPHGVRDIRAGEVAISCEAITGWGLDAPIVVPGVPGGPPQSTLGGPVYLVPLVTPSQTRLHPRGRVFAIVPPTDGRADRDLCRECSGFLRKAEKRG